jgi:hypothetical protein
MARKSPSKPNPKVFVTYSHDSDDHRERVLRLTQRLREDGFDAMIDRYVEGMPPQGWPRWMQNQIEGADYVLLVCTRTYYLRFRGKGPRGTGKGVAWEGAVITNELYDGKSVSRRFIPVLFDAVHSRYVPDPLRGFGAYIVMDEDAYARLTDHLAGVAGIQPIPLGPAPNRRRKTAAPLRFHGSNNAGTSQDEPVTAPVLSGLSAPGGTMPAGHACYVERGADREATAAGGCRCETVVVRGPRQFGKSSLLVRYVALCRHNGKAVVSVNFSMFEEAIISRYGAFLSALAATLARHLRLPAPPGNTTTQQKFISFIEYTLLASLEGPVVFVFDETDRIMRQAYAQDFFSMVRSWHDNRADPAQEWHKLGLALVTSSEPKLFIKNALTSPFNVGLRLSLEPFTAAELAVLNARYGSPLSDAECAQLHRLAGGHPFLTQEAFYRVCGPARIGFSELCEEAAHGDGPFGEHLRAMLSNVRAGEGLLAAMQRVIASGAVERDTDFYRLEGAGLVRRDNDRIVPANQVYADFFRGVR